MNKTVFCCFLVGVLLSALAVECSAQSHFVRFSLDEAYIGEYPPQENRDILRSVGSSTSVGFGYRYSRRHFLLYPCNGRAWSHKDIRREKQNSGACYCGIVHADRAQQEQGLRINVATRKYQNIKT